MEYMKRISDFFTTIYLGYYLLMSKSKRSIKSSTKWSADLMVFMVQIVLFIPIELILGILMERFFSLNWYYFVLFFVLVMFFLERYLKKKYKFLSYCKMRKLLFKYEKNINPIIWRAVIWSFLIVLALPFFALFCFWIIG
jgi:putative exporter of polyketide antibiotics